MTAPPAGRAAPDAAARNDARFRRRFDACRQALEDRAATCLGGARGPAIASTRLEDAMRYAALGGGKRFRPFLLIETSALFGLSEASALDAALAVECVHCYSLAHDDLPAMDDDDLRRGRPTLHKAFDEATAILAGDGLLTLAFEILSQPGAHPDPAVRIELVAGLARASGWKGMVGGQMLDLAAERMPASLLDIHRIQTLKTGALIEFSVEAGAILGRAGAPERAALGSYARALGLAFQVADDLLDAEGDTLVVGKATIKDAAAGKATFVSLLGIGAAKEKLDKLEAEAMAALHVFGEKADVLREAARFVSRRRQ